MLAFSIDYYGIFFGATQSVELFCTYIVTEKDTYEVYEKLNEIEKSLKNCKMPFLRVHQSFLVNYRHVDGLAYDFVIMDNGKKISISEDRRKMISEQYCSMEDTFYVGE